ncbi:MAG: penicillin-binding transpeptidase domain-containing protein [Bdellovibrionales bacterium]
MRIRHKLRLLWISVGLIIAVGSAWALQYFQTEPDPLAKKLTETLEARFMVAQMVNEKVKNHDWTNSLQAEFDGEVENLNVKWTLDDKLQNYADSIFKSYKPDYGAVFLFDAETGRVLALSSFQKGKPTDSSLALRATYPAASVFKVITATAAIDNAGLKPGHNIRFNGGNYTLYKKNVMSDRINRWTRTVTLKDAFSKSLNTAFGRLVLEELEPETLNEYANRFMFNQDLATDFPVEKSIALVPSEKNYELTQVASGFNRFNRMSPVVGAMIASAIVNDGRVVVPYLVDEITDADQKVIYRGETLEKGQVMAEVSAQKMRTMMEETVLTGTSRKSFRSLVRSKKFREVQMGGKTGHLTGDNPKGRTDWFVGYAFDEDRRLAIAAITVNEKFWTIKSSQVAQMMFRKFFEPVIAQRTAASENKENQVRQ